MFSTRHMGHDVAYTTMAWTDEALSLSFWYVLAPITKWFQHRNCESGSNTSNTAIKEVSCSWLLSNSFANHLSINMWHENMQNQSCKWFIARCMLYRCTFRPVTQLGGACSRPPQLYCHTWSTIALVHLQNSWIVKLRFQKGTHLNRSCITKAV